MSRGGSFAISTSRPRCLPPSGPGARVYDRPLPRNGSTAPGERHATMLICVVPEGESESRKGNVYPQGWAKAGITNVKLTSTLLDEFLKSDTLPAARRVLTDNSLTPISAASGAVGIFEANPNRTAVVIRL